MIAKTSLCSTLSFALLFLFVISCKKDDLELTPVQPTACVLQKETTSLAGNQMSWTYEYGTTGSLSAIKQYNAYGTHNATLEVNGTIIVKSAVFGPAVPESVNTIMYESDPKLIQPTKASLSSQYGDEFSYEIRTYFFFFDSKGRLVRVGEQTDHVLGDLEWDLEITYNGDDNVTSLYYNITTGPGNSGSRITIKAYDDKPTPYAGIQNWKFIMNNYSWDHNDPEPIITALSKNNPLDYTLNAGTTGEYKRKMAYEYSADGYPTKRINTNINSNGEYTFEQTFEYTCN